MKKASVGIIGCGAIGSEVAFFLEKELSGKTNISVLADIYEEKAQSLREKLSSRPKIYSLKDTVSKVDLIIEAASVDAARCCLKEVYGKKKDIIILSIGALIGENEFLRKVQENGTRVWVPSGAICGVDGLGALSMGKIQSIKLITSKPPAGLIGASYLEENKIDLSCLTEEKIIFKGGVKEAISCFPRNINVAATLLLASSSEKVEVIIKADPQLKRNIHRIEIKSSHASVAIEVQNIPSKNNPKTSALAILSTQYLLKKMFSSLKIGS
ncbi:MAG: aspartate dehydrogenase domain-containing protein [Candidatus Omnitrophota bacterium]